MKKKILMASIATLFLVASVSLTRAYADHGGGVCPISGDKCGYGGGGFKHGHSGSGGDLDKMFFMKAHFILENSDELGLTEDKVEAIKSLKTDTLKSLIKQNADIAVACIDIKSKLHDYPIDVASTNALVDQKYELKKAKTKTLIDALAKLKGTLTQEQYDKLREIWKGGKEGKHHGHGQ